MQDLLSELHAFTVDSGSGGGVGLGDDLLRRDAVRRAAATAWAEALVARDVVVPLIGLVQVGEA